ncbi:MBL fold metallo-hydrolase [Isoptericola jiangsuensis]|uniref:MBL fold metallo-hydrolase n=1 Tax=Isoptericola jiangsuensis TaxID=548579 RepID=UPI003AACE35E
MTGIELSTWGQAGVRLERDGARLAIDPGALTDPQVLDGAAAVLITHEHPDHVVPERLAATLEARADLRAWAPEPVVEALRSAGAPADRLHAVSSGQEFSAGGFAVRALGGSHAVIHPALPVPANLAYLVEGVVLHPGDSYTPAPDGVDVDVLALPVGGPWVKVSEAVDYAVAVAPRVVVPIHDAVLSDAGKGAADRIAGGLVDRLLESGTYRRLAPGEVLTVVG